MTEMIANWVWNVPVIVILIAGLIMLIYGWKQGFMKMALSILSVVIAVVVVWVFTDPVVSWISKNTSVDEHIQTKVEKILEETEGEQDQEAEETKTHDETEVYENVQKILNKLHLPVQIQGVLAKKIGSLKELRTELSNQLTSYILKAAIGAILFFLTLILLKVLIHALNIVSHLPVLHQLNGFLGAVLALMEGWIFLNIIFLLLTTLIQAPWGKDVLMKIRENPLTDWLYQHNFLFKAVN